MGIARKKKKKTLKAKMLGILTMCAMTSLLAAVIVSYMELRMIQNDSIEDNMKMYLDQITKNTDEAYYDMIQQYCELYGTGRSDRKRNGQLS